VSEDPDGKRPRAAVPGALEPGATVGVGAVRDPDDEDENQSSWMAWMTTRYRLRRADQ
jgi:hypothetical protein